MKYDVKFNTTVIKKRQFFSYIKSLRFPCSKTMIEGTKSPPENVIYEDMSFVKIASNIDVLPTLLAI